MTKQRFSRPEFSIAFERLDRFAITPEDAAWSGGKLKMAVMAGIVYEACRMAKRNGCRAGEFFLETSVERIYERTGLTGGGHNSYSGPFREAVAHHYGDYVRGHGAVLPPAILSASPKGSLSVRLEHCEAFGLKGAVVLAAIGNGYMHKDFMGPVVYSNTYIHNRLMGLMSRKTMENTLRELEEAGAIKDIREKFGRQYRVWNVLPDNKLSKLCKGIIRKRADELENMLPNKEVRRDVAEQAEKGQRGLRRGVLSMAEYCEQQELDKLEQAVEMHPGNIDEAIAAYPMDTYAATCREDLRNKAAAAYMTGLFNKGLTGEELYTMLHTALAEADRMLAVRRGYKARRKAREERAAGRIRRFVGAGNATVKRMRDALLPWGARGFAARMAALRSSAMAT